MPAVQILSPNWGESQYARSGLNLAGYADECFVPLANLGRELNRPLLFPEYVAHEKDAVDSGLGALLEFGLNHGNANLGQGDDPIR